jgi:ketosteroid isomerase-like protein
MDQHGHRARRIRWLTRWVAPLTAGVLLVAPGLPGSGTGPARAEPAPTDQSAVDLNLQRKWVELFNGRKWDELGAIYEDDAIALMPNHEPIRGRAAIVAFFQSIRDGIGEVTCGEPARITASGDLVSLVADDCSSYHGQLRYTMHELYGRQPDGSLRYKVDMVGERDPLK